MDAPKCLNCGIEEGRDMGRVGDITLGSDGGSIGLLDEGDNLGSAGGIALEADYH